MIFNHEADTISGACGFATVDKPYELVLELLSRIGKEHKIPTDLSQEQKVALIFVFIHTASASDTLSIIYNTTKISGAIEAFSTELNPNQIQLMLGDVMADFLRVSEEKDKNLATKE
jgi:hypothetical protein